MTNTSRYGRYIGMPLSDNTDPHSLRVSLFYDNPSFILFFQKKKATPYTYETFSRKLIVKFEIVECTSDAIGSGEIRAHQIYG